MTTITFDTRKAVRNLQAAGFAEAQAEAFTDTVATKTDITEIKADIVTVRADIEKLEASTKADIAEVKAEIGRLEGRVFRALWIQGGGIVALIVGLTKLL